MLAGFAVEEFLEFLELLWILRRQVRSEAKIVPHVVELPDILFERPELFGGVGHAVQPVAGASPPALVVDGTAAGQLQVLRRVPVLGLRVVKGVEHAHPFYRHLLDAVDALRFR